MRATLRTPGAALSSPSVTDAAQTAPPGSDTGHRQWLHGPTSLLRSLPVGKRIHIMVGLNGLALLALGALLVFGSSVIRQQWEEVRGARALDRLFVGIDSDIGRLQGLVHRYLHTPTADLLAEIAGGQAALLGKMDRIATPDAGIAADVERLSHSTRRFFAGFESLRDILERKQRTYESAILNAGAEMPTLYATLEATARGASPALTNDLNRVRELFSDALIAANAFYLTGDPAAAERARDRLISIASAIPRLQDLVDNPLQGGAVRAVLNRVVDLRDAIAVLRDGFEQQARVVAEEVDGGQQAMSRLLDGLLAEVRRREADTEHDFDATFVSAGVLLGVLGVGFLTASAAVSWMIGHSIGGPLHRLTEAMAAIAGGNYRTVVPGTGANDEIGAMARALEVSKDDAIARQVAEQAREALEQRWRTMLQSSPVGISIVNSRTHQRLYTNPRYEALFGGGGATRQRAVTESFADPEEFGRMLAAFARDGVISGHEALRRRTDGALWWCLHDVRAMEIDGQPCHIVWHYDVTARRRGEEDLRAAKERAELALADLRATQQSLIQAEKMAALGSLVAGVAHEVNTPIGITVTAASLLSDVTRDFAGKVEAGAVRRSDMHRYIETALEASDRLFANAHRAAELIQSFKQVAVDQTRDDRRDFDLGQYVHEVLLSLQPRLRPAGHAVEVRCPEPLVVDGYPGPFAQVLTNLVVNSLIHAYAPGQAGRITIDLEADGPEGVRMTYRDDGRGIPADVLPRIFDPFFTTNRAGGGTGLGLHIVFNIVRQKLRGDIAVESAPGQGVCFTLRFPARIGDGAAA